MPSKQKFDQSALKTEDHANGLERRLGLKEAVALNMIEIVGIGPFVVSGLVIKAMGGPQALLAWIAGAVLAALDGFVWAELGAAMPQAGGTYVFLREAFGPGRWGRLMSFLFAWQAFVYVPLSVASASIGFARYAGYLHPLTTWQAKALSGGLVVFLVILLYRRITTLGKISVLLWIGVVATMLWVIWGGLRHFDAKLAFDFPPKSKYPLPPGLSLRPENRVASATEKGRRFFLGVKKKRRMEPSSSIGMSA